MFSALDSGIIGHSGPRDAIEAQLQSACAHQMGIPITSVSTDFCQVVENAAKKHEIEIFSCSASPEEAAFKVKENFHAYIAFASEVGRAAITSTISFPHPLYRLLKDYYFVRIIEIVCWYGTLKSGIDDKTILHAFQPLDDRCEFKYAIRRFGDRFHIFGPITIEKALDEGVTKQYRDTFEEAFRNFHSNIEKSGGNQGGNEGNVGQSQVLHTNESLLRMAFSRQKLMESEFKNRIRLIGPILGSRSLLTNWPKQNGVPPTFFSKYVAAGLAAVETQETVSFSYKTFPEPGMGPAPAAATVGVVDGFLVLEMQKTEQSTIVQSKYKENIERSFLYWSVFVSESISILRTWLQRHSGVLRPENQNDGSTERFRYRLARFLTFLFNADEVSIYKLVHDGAAPSLLPFAHFDRYGKPNNRFRHMSNHISEVLGTPLEKRSIVVRAFRENEIQYCQSHDMESGACFPNGQTISFPEEHRDCSWGRSICALPIRVSGIFWGVLELVSDRPHSFSETVRAKVSEAIVSTAPLLFERDIFAYLSKINSTIVSDTTSQEKRVRLQPVVRGLLACKTFAVLRIDGNEVNSVSAFLTAGRDDIERATDEATPSSREYLLPYLRFRNSKDAFWSAKIGSSQFDELFGSAGRKKFFQEMDQDFICLAKVSWGGEEENASPGVIVVTYSHELDEQENWPSVIGFVCQYLATVTKSLYGSEQWESTVRQKLAHEFTKVVASLDATQRKLKSEVYKVPRDTKQINRGLMTNLVSDLQRHRRSLDINTEILKQNRIISDFESDPRLYMVSQRIEDWRSKSDHTATRFRPVFNSVFWGASRDFRKVNIKLPELDSAVDKRLLVDDWSLEEVLTTLKSNILKYGQHATAVTVREHSTVNFGIRISNIGFTLRDDEVDRIFLDEVRGGRAVDFHPDDGSGFGLWYADRVMKELGCGISHSQLPLEDGVEDPEYSWHHFTLTFPWAKVSQTSEKAR